MSETIVAEPVQQLIPAKGHKGFVKGQSGNPLGKKKGTKHGRHFDVAKIMAEIEFIRWSARTGEEEWEKGVNPFVELAHLMINAKSEMVRYQAAAELASYLAPKLKHIEMSSDAENPINIVLNLGQQKV